MSVDDISNLFWFLGGLGMFLYGMSIMADGMQKSAGGKMSQFLGMLTNNRIMAVCLGAVITAIIQSSGATTTGSPVVLHVRGPRLWWWDLSAPGY